LWRRSPAGHRGLHFGEQRNGTGHLAVLQLLFKLLKQLRVRLTRGKHLLELANAMLH
jgi:hypothetical protein